MLKIGFTYKMNNGQYILMVGKEFIAETKEHLLSEIQDFMKRQSWMVYFVITL